MSFENGPQSHPETTELEVFADLARLEGEAQFELPVRRPVYFLFSRPLRLETYNAIIAWVMAEGGEEWSPGTRNAPRVPPSDLAPDVFPILGCTIRAGDQGLYLDDAVRGVLEYLGVTWSLQNPWQ